VRTGTIAAQPRTQESVAISVDGAEWFLLNASPEIRSQIESFAPLHPRAPRHTALAGILITNGDLDHCLGLLSLRESQPLQLYATRTVRRGFTQGNALYGTLERFAGQVSWHALELGQWQPLLNSAGRPSELSVRALGVPGQPPLHLRGHVRPDEEDNIALCLRDERRGSILCYASGVAAITPALRQAIGNSAAVFFDGTFWSSDELIALGLGERRAEDMAHLPVGGSEGSLRALGPATHGRRIYIHVNNTNPMLREDSRERAELSAAGWEVAHDGLELEI